MCYIAIMYETSPPPRLRRCGLTLFIALVVGALLVGCPLPFEFTGEGSGIAGKRKLNGSTITAPVTFAYAEASGATDTIVHGGSHLAKSDTIVTLTTLTPNATLYYTTDDSRITDIDAPAVRRVDATSTTYTITRTLEIEQRTIHAVAIGPHMRPGPVTIAKVEVTPFRVLAYDRNGPGTLTGGAIPPGSTPKVGLPVTVADPKTAPQMLRTVPGDIFYEFDGWNTAANGSGTRYNAGTGFPMPEGNVTLYARWARVYRLEYDQNGTGSLTGGAMPATGYYRAGTHRFTDWRFPPADTACGAGNGSSRNVGDLINMLARNTTACADWQLIPPPAPATP